MGKFHYSLGQPAPFRPRIRAGGLLFHLGGARVVGVGAARSARLFESDESHRHEAPRRCLHQADPMIVTLIVSCSAVKVVGE